VLDNASNNDTLVRELPNLLDNFQGSVTRIRCFAHVLNLVVKVRVSLIARLICLHPYKAILSQFYKKKNSKDDECLSDDRDDDEVEPDDDAICHDDSDEIDPAVASSDEAMIQEVIDSLDGDVEDDDDATKTLRHLTSEEINLGCYSVSKVSTMTIDNVVHHSDII
jgi:hypothetical protein